MHDEGRLGVLLRFPARRTRRGHNVLTAVPHRHPTAGDTATRPPIPTPAPRPAGRIFTSCISPARAGRQGARPPLRLLPTRAEPDAD